MTHSLVTRAFEGYQTRGLVEDKSRQIMGAKTTVVYTMLDLVGHMHQYSSFTLDKMIESILLDIDKDCCGPIELLGENMVWHGLLWDIYALVCVSSGRQVEQEYLRISQDLSAEGRS